MTDKKRAKFEWPLVAPEWGHFNIDGDWCPNPFLTMSIEQQRRENIENGYMTDNGKRPPARRKETPP
jgi:hypothetical protein